MPAGPTLPETRQIEPRFTAVSRTGSGTGGDGLSRGLFKHQGGSTKLQINRIFKLNNMLKSESGNIRTGPPVD